MTKKQAIKGLKENLCSLCAYGSQNMDSCDIRECDNRDYIKALERQSSEDCVSRKAILEMIEQIQDAGGFIGYSTYSEALYQVNNMSPVTHTQRWIPVSERLPEPNRLVVCYITTGATETYFLALWNDIQKVWEEGIGGYRLLERDLGYKVIAWQPLPKPYEEK